MEFTKAELEYISDHCAMMAFKFKSSKMNPNIQKLSGKEDFAKSVNFFSGISMKADKLMDDSLTKEE